MRAGRRWRLLLSTSLLLAVSSPTEVQGRQQPLPEAAAPVTLVTVEPASEQIRRAELVAPVQAASDEDVTGERGIIDATSTSPLAHGWIRVRWMSFRVYRGPCCLPVKECSVPQ